MDILRPAQKRDPHAGPDGRRLPCELRTLLFEFGDRVVDAGDAQPDMLEPEMRRLRRRGNVLPDDASAPGTSAQVLEVRGFKNRSAAKA